MSKRGYFNGGVFPFFGVLLLALVVTAPVCAQECFPDNAVLEQAELWIYADAVELGAGHVYVHQISSDWDEMTVTWSSFGNSFVVASVADGDVVDGAMWYTYDVTSLVMGWWNGDYPNYGLLLRSDEGVPFLAKYVNRESAAMLPAMLMVTYSVDGIVQEPVWLTVIADTHINEYFPWLNLGGDEQLRVGWLNDYRKYALLRFDYCFEEVPPNGSGTGTPGYWKNHPDAWPVDEILAGCMVYTKAEAIELLDQPEKGDKTFSMFRALVAAKLNVLNGSESSCIVDYIDMADVWLATYGSLCGNDKVKAKSPAWEMGEPIAWMLDDYNNGLLCASYGD
jgi:hypothetical protein